MNLGSPFPATIGLRLEPMPSRRPALLSLFVFMMLSLAGFASAQERGGISGKVTDKRTGHAIPFATVTVVGAQKGGLTDSEGRYLVTGLPAGTYELRVQFLGYSPSNQPGVVVT